MRVHFTGRHLDVTPALESFTQERLQKLQKILPAIIEVHVILHVEKYRHQAEINVRSRGFSLSGAHESDDMYASISQVFEKLGRQTLKRKTKQASRKHRPAGARPSAATPRRTTAARGGRRASASSQVVRTDVDELKPMSVEDAILQIQDSKRNFVVFRNARSQRVNVVYIRRDGQFGVIEP